VAISRLEQDLIRNHIDHIRIDRLEPVVEDCFMQKMIQ
jgi:hypothetical protein